MQCIAQSAMSSMSNGERCVVSSGERMCSYLGNH